MIVDPDERWFGDLVLIDPDTLAEHHTDSRVSLAASYELWHGVFDPELVAYAVSDGDRSGV